MPMLSLVFPSNASYFLNMLITLSNFQMIPTEDILDKMFKFLKEIKDKNGDETDESYFGYEKDNFMGNTS
jgi:hypothetical protein